MMEGGPIGVTCIVDGERYLVPWSAVQTAKVYAEPAARPEEAPLSSGEAVTPPPGTISAKKGKR